jgi:NAD(P)-dependent dehydrogenase (short-subunit alcohol dehydrogenase family)
VKGFVADTSDDAAVKTGVAGVLGGFGRVDILVNCAAAVGGQGKPPTLAEITNEAFFADINVKVLGYLRTIREVVPHMAIQGGGRIINVSGLAALHTGSTIGSIRNVGVAALTKNFADELAPSGISVVCVYPGRTRTEKTAEFVERQAKAHGVTAEEIERQLAGANLARRVITADEIAYLVAFLASPKSIAINGDPRPAADRLEPFIIESLRLSLKDRKQGQQRLATTGAADRREPSGPDRRRLTPGRPTGRRRRPGVSEALNLTPLPHRPCQETIGRTAISIELAALNERFHVLKRLHEPGAPSFLIRRPRRIAHLVQPL